MIGGEFSERMSSGSANVLVDRVLGQRPDSGAVRKESGLRIASQGKLVRRSLEAEAAQVQPERGVDLAKNTAGDRKCLGQIFSHSRLLRALAWEKEYDVHG